MQDAAGNPMLFSWDLEHAETWTPGLPLDTNVVAASYDPPTKLYVHDSNQIIHQIDPATGKTEQTGSAPALWDMAYSSTHSTEERPSSPCIYDGYFYPLQRSHGHRRPKDQCKDEPERLECRVFVAVACLGTANYLGYECDRYLCMDDKDGLWNIFIYYGKDESGTVGYYSAGARR